MFGSYLSDTIPVVSASVTNIPRITPSRSLRNTRFMDKDSDKRLKEKRFGISLSSLTSIDFTHNDAVNADISGMFVASVKCIWVPIPLISNVSETISRRKVELILNKGTLNKKHFIPSSASLFLFISEAFVYKESVKIKAQANLNWAIKNR